MTIRDQANKAFSKPMDPPQRQRDDAAAIELQRRAEQERKTETAVDAKLAEVLRQHQTAELTPEGTRPKTPPTERQARDLAEKLVAADALKQRESERDSVPAEPAPQRGASLTDAERSELEAVAARGDIEETAQAAFKIGDAAGWTVEERQARVAERVAAIEAAQQSAQQTKTHDPGHEM